MRAWSRASSVVALAAVLAGLASCRAPRNERAPDSTPSSQRSAPAADAASSADAARGSLVQVDAADLDAPTLALLQAAAKCPEIARCHERGVALMACGARRDCAAYREWTDAPSTSAGEPGTLVALLGHGEELVRSFAVARLAEDRLDGALARRALTAIGGERSPRLATTMGELAARIAETHPGVAADIDAMVRTHPLSALREALAYGVTSTACCGNGPGEVPKLKLGRACLGGLVKDPDAALRSWSRSALGLCIGTADPPPAALPRPICADLMTLLDIRDDAALAQAAVRRILYGCAEHREEVLRRAATMSSDGNAWRTAALSAFCAAPVDLSGTAAERRRAVSTAAKIARARGVAVDVRAEALDVVEACMVNAGSDPFSYSRLHQQLMKDVEPGVHAKRGGSFSGRP